MIETSSTPHFWFGKYRLSSRLGTGGMAEVYAGRRKNDDGTLGHLVAVKRLLPHLAKDKSIVRMFLNEARVTAQIKHHNVVRIFDLGDVEGEPFISMELLDGRTWAELRDAEAERAKRMPLSIAIRILSEACRGLDAAHRATTDEGQPLALVHRDFTPENIHVGAKGEIKVIDFGIAKTSAWSMGTEPGTLKGKFFYMSPEMILSQPVDLRADIFAAGVMLYEQLCGRRPFTGATINDVVARIAAGNPTPPSVFDPSIPVACESVALKALQHDPRKRFQSLAEFADALELLDPEHLASAKDAQEYLTALFKSQNELKQANLLKAIEADPSIPNLQIVSDVPREPTPAANNTPPPTGKNKRVFVFVGLGAALAIGVAAAVFVKGNEIKELFKTNVATSSELLAKATAEINARNGKKAEATLDLAESLDANNAQVDALRAKLKEAQGDIKGALAALSKALEKAPLDDSYWNEKGRLLSASGRLDEAVEALQKAIKMNPSARAFSEYGSVLLRQNKLSEAQIKLEASLKLNAQNAEANYYLGSVLYQRGMRAKAKESFEKAIALEPTDSRFWMALCTVNPEGLPDLKSRIQKQFTLDAAKWVARCESEGTPK
jgi:eukaryotic-like serine/threonine-protein kinase